MPAVTLNGTCGFFLFDYNQMDTYYGKQAFDAIYAALRNSSGICAFHDGDFFNIKTVGDIARQASLVRPSSLESPLVNPDAASNFGPYAAGMWSDKAANFDVLHNGLIAAALLGYVGYMTAPGRHEYAAAVHLFMHQLGLPQSIALKDGAIIKGTSKYGIGFRPPDRALLWACAVGKLEAARDAIEAGADVNCIDPTDRASTPIVHAASNGHLALVKLVLAHGADPNAENAGTNSALMLAARFGHLQIVTALIAAGAHVNARDHSGGTALDNAKDHPEILRILRKAGALGRA